MRSTKVGAAGACIVFILAACLRADDSAAAPIKIQSELHILQLKMRTGRLK